MKQKLKKKKSKRKNPNKFEFEKELHKLSQSVVVVKYTNKFILNLVGFLTLKGPFSYFVFDDTGIYDDNSRSTTNIKFNLFDVASIEGNIITLNK